MQKIITSVAFFRICDKCGAHGHIILTNDIELPVRDKESGCELADNLTRRGTISPEECNEICVQIRGASSIPNFNHSYRSICMIGFRIGLPEPKDDYPIDSSLN